jgi:hypothetical protein
LCELFVLGAVIVVFCELCVVTRAGVWGGKAKGLTVPRKVAR